MMLNIFELERAIHDKPSVKISNDYILIEDSQIKIKRVPESSVRFHVDMLKFSGGAIQTQGWAFSQLSHEPAKRIFIIRDERIIAVAKPQIRVDVRQKLGLSYDHTGFNALIETADVVFENEAMNFLVFVDQGALIKESVCKSAHKSKFVNSEVEIDEGSRAIRFTNTQNKKKISLKRDKDIRIVIDSFDYANGTLYIRGWSLHTKSPETPLSTGVLIENKVVALPRLGNEIRPDVAAAFHFEDQVRTFGFKISVAVPKHLMRNMSEVKVISLADELGDGVANIKPLIQGRRILPKIFSSS